MATTDTPLSTNPASLNEPEKQQALPKSYAEVLEEDLPPYERISSSQTNGTNGAMNESQTNGAAPVLRIVNTSATGERREEVGEGRHQSERSRSNDGYAADVCIHVLFVPW